ncbi:Uncharacterised protein [Vibrio cholerae]|nr:Uncharacterised protein [Vibrio cholerae]
MLADILQCRQYRIRPLFAAIDTNHTRMMRQRQIRKIGVISTHRHYHVFDERMF